MSEPLGLRIANGNRGGRLLMIGVFTAKKLLVVPVSAIAGNDMDEEARGGPTEEVADKHVHIVLKLLSFTNLLFVIAATKAVGSPRPYSGAPGRRRRARRPVMIVLLPPCMLVTVASILWPSCGLVHEALVCW